MSKTPKKAPYQKPSIKKIGSLKDLSQTASNSGAADGGSAPYNKMHCLTPPTVIDEHRQLISDTQCQLRYRQEIRAAVRPGDIVVDVGVGSGIHTLFALQAGAKKVYAIDGDNIIHSARELITANNFSDRVTFIKKDSKDVELPEKADVLISNIGFVNTLNDIPDAIARFLKPNGRAIPDALQISFAPATAEGTYAQHTQIWSNNTFGIDFSTLRKASVNHPMYFKMSPDQLLADHQSSDIVSLKKSSDKVLKFQLHYEIKTAAICHGIGGWYSFFTNNAEFLSTRPPLELNEQLWSNFLLPFDNPVELRRNSSLFVEIEMHRELFGTSSIWVWRATLDSRLIASQSSFTGIMTEAAPSLNEH